MNPLELFLDWLVWLSAGGPYQATTKSGIKARPASVLKLAARRGLAVNPILLSKLEHLMREQPWQRLGLDMRKFCVANNDELEQVVPALRGYSVGTFLVAGADRIHPLRSMGLPLGTIDNALTAVVSHPWIGTLYQRKFTDQVDLVMSRLSIRCKVGYGSDEITKGLAFIWGRSPINEPVYSKSPAGNLLWFAGASVGVMEKGRLTLNATLPHADYTALVLLGSPKKDIVCAVEFSCNEDREVRDWTMSIAPMSAAKFPAPYQFAENFTNFGSPSEPSWFDKLMDAIKNRVLAVSKMTPDSVASSIVYASSLQPGLLATLTPVL